MLKEHQQEERVRAQELAAFSGYCAASAVAMWFTKGLPPFARFYQRPERPRFEPKSIAIARKLGDYND